MDISDSFDNEQQTSNDENPNDGGSVAMQFQNNSVTSTSGGTVVGSFCPSNDVDIDSILLQQFSCLGTTDHDDLINQFQSIMNNKINPDTARFFLDMSNWNLQKSICSYFDFCHFQSLPSMKITERSSLNDTRQMWRIQNSGPDIWPIGCYLMSPNQKKTLYLPQLKPGETCDILAYVPSTTPPMMWRLCTSNGSYFGEIIWMIPIGSPDTATDLADRMSHLLSLSSINSINNENFPDINVEISTSNEIMD